MKKLTLLLLLTLCAGAQAQQIIRSLESPVPGQGRVTIHLDEQLEPLLRDRQRVVSEQPIQKTAGYRIQVYAGNNSRNARNEAGGVASKVKEQFPDLKVYTSFTSPRWLCRVGDFRTIEEADAMMRKLKTTGLFKEVAIVKEQINIP